MKSHYKGLKDNLLQATNVSNIKYLKMVFFWVSVLCSGWMFQHCEVTYCLHLQSNCNGLGTCCSEMVKKNTVHHVEWDRQLPPFLDNMYSRKGTPWIVKHTEKWLTNLYLNARLHNHPPNKCSLLSASAQRGKVLCDQKSLQTTFYNNRQLKRHQAHSTIARADQTTERLPENSRLPATHPKHLLLHQQGAIKT